MVTIYQHLEACAVASLLQEHNTHTEAHHAFRRALEQDPEMRKEARALMHIAEPVLERDHISRWQVATLRGVWPKE